jgi:zinc protease
VNADRQVRNGAITVRAIHAPANLERVDAAVAEELAAARRGGFTQAELDAVKQAWAQRRIQALADEGNVASVLASNLYWDDTMKRWMEFDEKIRRATLQEVNDAFRKYLAPEQVLVLGAGDYGRTVN